MYHVESCFFTVLVFVCAVLGISVINPFNPEAAELRSRLGGEIQNTGKYLIWGDYKVEVNQYGGFGRDWPWQFKDEQFAMLKKKAEANPEPPNTIRAIFLVCPIVEATAYKKEGDKEVEVGRKVSKMTSAEVKSAIEQWRQMEELVYVFSGGNAWLRTDIKVIPEPLKVKTNEEWGHFSGPKYDLLDKYIPFERGEYDSYNSVYSNRGLSGGPWGGTIGALYGVKGMATSDNLWIARGKPTDDMHAWVFWHEWLNQCCSTTSNILPYTDNEELWNMYVWEWMGYRPDKIDLWPGWTNHRDMMRSVIRPKMWRRWFVTTPYVSQAIGKWVLFGPTKEEMAREISTKPDSDGKIIEMKMEKYTHFDIKKPQDKDAKPLEKATYYLRTFVESKEKQEVLLLAGGDERFQIWLNGIMVRDGWGWNYSDDDKKLFEKVTYTVLEKGINTVVFVLPNTDEKAEFRMRFAKMDGTGEQPEGVTVMATLDKGKPLPLKEPIIYDFKNPKFFKWEDIGDDPWLSMPRLTQSDLRDLTGISNLEVIQDGAIRKDEKGEDFKPGQHIFLKVPKESVSSPCIAEPAEDNAKLNNDFDFNWKAIAWLRVPGRRGTEKDILLVRNDVAEPIMHLLKTKERPGNESIVGWFLLNRKLCYVLLVDLDIEKSPETELGLLTQQPK